MNIPAGFAQASLFFTGDALPTGAAITLGINPSGLVVTPLLAATAVSDAWDASDMIRCYTNDCTLSSILVKFGPNDTGPSAEISAAAVGTFGGDTGYPGAALLVTKQTSLGGREGKGRFYLPGLGEAAIELGGNISTGVLADMQEAVGFLVGEFSERDIPLVLLHNSGTSPTVVEACVAAVRPGTQRRRNRR